MARAAVGLNVTSTVIGGEGFRAGRPADVVNSVSTADTVAALADVVADVAVLVADAATPTEAHVTTLDGHLTTLNEAWAALLVGTGAVSAYDDVILSYDITAVGNKSVLKRAILELLAQVDRTNDFAS